MEETPIIYTSKFGDEAYEYSDGSGRLVFSKYFAGNELVGEQLAKLRNLRTVEYFLTMENETFGKTFYGELESKNSGKLKISSYDFRKQDCNYLRCTRLGIYEDGFLYLLELCPSKKNRIELTNELLELFALDTYMGQDDRFYYNMLFEIDCNNNIHLAPIFDYEVSFMNNSAIYLNTLKSFPDVDSYRRFLEKFPQMAEMLKFYLDVNLSDEIKNILEAKKLDYSNVNFKFYEDYASERCKIISKILK